MAVVLETSLSLNIALTKYFELFISDLLSCSSLAKENNNNQPGNKIYLMKTQEISQVLLKLILVVSLYVYMVSQNIKYFISMFLSHLDYNLIKRAQELINWHCRKSHVNE